MSVYVDCNVTTQQDVFLFFDQDDQDQDNRFSVFFKKKQVCRYVQVGVFKLKYATTISNRR